LNLTTWVVTIFLACPVFSTDNLGLSVDIICQMKYQEGKKRADTEVPIKTLIYIPIIHTETDMGTLSESIQKSTLQKFGRRGLKRKEDMIDNLWMEIEQKIYALSLAYEKARLYQDGLPVCGREAEIVTDLAKAGSRNHRLLLLLMKRGATITGTESLELLMEEYELDKQILAARGTREKARIEASKKAIIDSLLKRRDRFISDRINSTLFAGETGILFIGMFHSLRNTLDNDIQVIYPLNPPFKKRGGLR